MSDVNFGAILDRPSTEIERPKPLPVGTYVCVVKGLPRQDKSARKGTEFVEFTLQPLGIYENENGETDVDPDELAAMGGFEKRTIRATYYLTEDAIWRLKSFLDDLGIEEGDKSLRQRISESPGHQVLAVIAHQASDDGQNIYANLKSTAPVE